MKKGTSQVDWIMSLGLFLLWVSWFFIFIKPQIDSVTSSNSNIDFLKNDFYDEFKLELVKYPLFIQSNSTGNYLPVIILQNRTDIKFLDGYSYVYFGNKLIFLANISESTEAFWILEGTNYNQSYFGEGLEVTENRFTAENFTAYPNEGLIDRVKYKERELLKNSEYFINDIQIVPENYTVYDYGFTGIYTASFGNFNMTSMMFDGNSEIQFFLKNFNEYDLKIDMELTEFDSYYSSNIIFGDFNYTEDQEYVNFTSDYVTLYGRHAFSIFFNSNATFNFTYYNETLLMTINIPLAEEDSFRYVFHDEDFDNISRYTYDTRFGVKETIHGLYLENITSNYTYFRQKWRYSENFNIQVYENSTVYNYLYEPKYEIGTNPGKIRVYAEKEDLNSLNMEGEKSPVSVSYRTW